MRHLKEINYIIELLKSAVTESVPSAPDSSLDWKFFYTLAKRHKIMSTLYFGMCKLPKEQQSDIGYFDSYVLEYKKNLVLDANRVFELERLKPYLKKNNIDYIFLKGSVSKYLYPDTAMRRMSDIDILFRNVGFDVLDEIFFQLGYRILHKDAKDTAYFNPVNEVKIEMQPHLIDKGYTLWYDYLEHIWERCDLEKNQMCKEDFYIYHIIHMAKHFVNGGIGLTHVLDIYMMLNKYTDLDESFVTAELTKLGLFDFHRNLQLLVQYWFDGVCPKQEDLRTIQLLEKYIFTSGAFGTRSQLNINAAVMRGDTKISLHKKLFPDIHTMINYYGKPLEEHRFLLPFYWIKLNVQRLRRGKNSVRRGFHNISGITEQQIDEAKELFRRCGL